ncbi:MAG: hypothetical protein CL842_02875 [Crocinitomicaceae bacterium]|nr:hypothetical protein [Crocinitomicaceae bacterium]|tara:strand:- start:160936 stop:162156 length:1221 start_codon:yes stop_codon:yes gene_type:complete
MERKSRNTLCLFTMNFPDGNSEEFLMAELPFLLQKFDEIRVYPIYSGKIELQRVLSDKIKVIHHGHKIEEGVSWLKLLVNIKFLISAFVLDLNFYGAIKTIKNIKYWIIYSNKVLGMLQFFKTDISTIEKPVFYSYWSLEWLSVFSLIDFGKEKQFVSRMLGIDVYEERHINGFVPWRRFSLMGAKKLFPNSLKSLEYVNAKHPNLRIKKSYLGTNDINKKRNKKAELVLLSSSRLIDLKRVYLIPPIVQKLHQKLVWMHWGDEGRDKVRAFSAAKSFLNESTYQFYPHESDVSKLYDFYNEHNNAIFIHLSETEGLPTSLIEAASMGFPIICTDAGGSREVVSHGVNGFVLPINFQIEEAVQSINKLLASKALREQFGIASRRIWEQNFSADNNYPDFIKRHILN